MGKSTRPVTPGVDLLDALDEWDLVMRQLNRSAETRKTYATSVRQLHAHQAAADATTITDEITPGHIRSYLVAVLDRSTPSTAVTAGAACSHSSSGRPPRVSAPPTRWPTSNAPSGLSC